MINALFHNTSQVQNSFLSIHGSIEKLVPPHYDVSQFPGKREQGIKYSKTKMIDIQKIKNILGSGQRLKYRKTNMMNMMKIRYILERERI